MIRVHSSTDTNYLNNMGIVVLKPSECKVKEVLNGIFTLELTHSFDLDNRWKALDGDNIIVASTPKGMQGFRILNTVKDMQSGRKIQAKHIFFDLEDNMLLDARPEGKNGKQALDIILAGATNTHNFKAESDILGLNTAYFVRKNIVQALLADEDNSFLSRWGGELYRDNYTINMRRKLGMDNGFVVKYRKNLTGLTETRDDKEIVTRIIPIGFNALMLDGSKPWVDSPLIGSYANIKSRVVDFPDIKVRDEQTGEDEVVFETVAEARAEMVKRCKQLYEEGLDKPKLTYNVEFADLSKTLEYKDFSFLETARLGDIVTVKHSKLGIDIKARVIEYEWDSIKEKYIKITLGAFQENLLQASVSAKDKINAILDGNNKVDTTMLEGMIDLMKVDMKAMHDVAVKHKELAILFEDLEEGSATFGAMALGTKGFMIAAKRTPDGREWDWRTFGTGQGFVADMIVAGYLDAARIKAGSIEANKLSVNAKGEIREGLVTETEFNVSIDGINTEVKKKVNEKDIISSINQTAEAVKIKANKIELNGATSIGDSSGNHVKIEDANYTVNNGGTPKAFIGFKDIGAGSGYKIPKIALGSDGYNPHNEYYTIVPYKPHDNPGQFGHGYVDMAYNCPGLNDYSNIKMFGSGDIRIAPVRDFEITTNFVNWQYSGTHERRLALFSTSSTPLFNNYLEIQAVRNETNDAGLVIADAKPGRAWTQLRLTTNAEGGKHFFPVTSDVTLGTGGYPWRQVYSTRSLNSAGVFVQDILPTNNNTQDTIDKIKFIQPMSDNSPILMDVTSLVGTRFAPISNVVDKGEEPGFQHVDTTELLKLALMEIKKLKEEVKLLEQKQLESRQQTKLNA